MKKFLLIAMTVLLTACGGGGNEFVGKWQDLKRSSTVVIERKGETFLIKDDLAPEMRTP